MSNKKNHRRGHDKIQDNGTTRLIERDFLDEIIEERTVKNPKFLDKVKEATKKRRQKGDKNEDIS